MFAIATKLSRTSGEEWAVVSSLGMNGMNNHASAYPGDILDCRNTFTEKRVSSSRPELGILNYRCELFNQHNKLVFDFIGAALYKLKQVG